MTLLSLVIFLLAICWTQIEAKRGCYENGRYYGHHESWPNSTFPRCLGYKCHDGQVYDVLKGCIHEGECRKVREKWRIGCIDYKCTRKREDYVTYYTVQPSAKCSYKGKCIRNGKSVRDGCDKLTCKVLPTPSGGSVAVMERTGRCQFKSRCYDNGATWSRGCIKYTCTVKKRRGRTSKKVRGIPACKFKGQCYKIGSEWEYKCTTFTCKRYRRGKEQGAKPTIIKAACPFNGKCYEEGTTWDDDEKCVVYTCERKARKERRYQCQVISRMKGCMMRGRCREFGYTTTDSKCTTWVCAKRGDRSSRVVVAKAGCKDFKGKCRNIGDRYTKTSGGIKQNCRCKRRSRKRALTVCEVEYEKKK